MAIKRKVNFKVVIYSIIGLACLYLSYKIDWFFLVGSAVTIYLSQRELMKK